MYIIAWLDARENGPDDYLMNGPYETLEEAQDIIRKYIRGNCGDNEDLMKEIQDENGNDINFYHYIIYEDVEVHIYELINVQPVGFFD